LERVIPRTMSTQHPDNASLPAWVSGNVIQDDAEVYEAYYAFKELGCTEVMWDSEGKDVDTHVVRKLLSNYAGYFKDKILGKDVFLTYRVPNPSVEFAERKILLESLVNIPVAHDLATEFYEKETSPIFEIILPFTTNSKELIGLSKYYEKTIVGIEKIKLWEEFKVADWIGAFKPEKIEVIPLIEDMNSLLKIDAIIKPYIKIVRPKQLRIFIARSDPALNYGVVCAVILCKLAFSKLKLLENATDTLIYPILGVGTLPFRGHLSPYNITHFFDEYKGVCTVTIQSAFKYDYPLKDVKKSVDTLNSHLPCGELAVIEPSEAEILKTLLLKFMKKYQRIVEILSPFVNSVAAYIPRRRARKLHIGLFGYSRNVGKAILPRAITFAAVLYSLGIPPEFIGLEAISNLGEAEWNTLKAYYVNLKHDLESVSGFLSWRNINMIADLYGDIAKKVKVKKETLGLAIANLMKDLATAEENLGVKLGPKNLSQRKYENMINDFLISFLEDNRLDAKKYVVEAAVIRRCLG
jgi:phosphoenolpyruvate carboxylase